MAQFVMPKLSDTMEEGTILQWLAGDGDAAEKGQPIVEIETDKANMTVEAPESGALHLLAAEGDVLAVGEPIAEIGEGAAPEAADEEPVVVLPDDDSGDEHPYEWLRELLLRRGIETSVEQLRSVPYTVEFSDRLERHLQDKLPSGDE